MSDFSASDYMKGKRLFLTGGTGFLGKVILFQLLKGGNLERIYILIRGKKGQTIEHRLKTQILDQPCFDALKGSLGLKKFYEYTQRVIFPVEGDLKKEDLGISEEDIAMVKEKCHIFIHNAADVGYKNSIQVALRSNYFPALFL